MTAQLRPSGERWIYQLWGCPDIHVRQKWSAVWPHLAHLRGPVSILDAGCGSGKWAIEIAARRPDWTIAGIDRNAEAIQRAREDAKSLNLKRVSFMTEDFLQFRPPGSFDVVLSIASAHYLVEAGRGEELFGCFRKWLRDDGILLLLGPRCRKEVPLVTGLPKLPEHAVFSRSDLEHLCRSAALDCESLQPLIGALGTAAKQLASCKMSRFGRAGAYPFEVILNSADRLWSAEASSAAWLMVARKASKSPQVWFS